MTMTEIRVDEFSGIEIESYPTKRDGSFLNRILGKNVKGKDDGNRACKPDKDNRERPVPDNHQGLIGD
jgi:hypothetical protein